MLHALLRIVLLFGDNIVIYYAMHVVVFIYLIKTLDYDGGWNGFHHICTYVLCLSEENKTCSFFKTFYSLTWSEFQASVIVSNLETSRKCTV